MLVFSYGNESLENSFSVNKSLLNENLHEAALINQRHVYNVILEAEGIQTININQNVMSRYTLTIPAFEIYQSFLFISIS